MLKRILQFVLGLVVVLGAVYVGDGLAVRQRKDPTSTVEVRPYTAVPRKDKREEFLFDDPYDQPCVNALFPHEGIPPCWYVRRHTQRRTNL